MEKCDKCGCVTDELVCPVCRQKDADRWLRGLAAKKKKDEEYFKKQREKAVPNEACCWKWTGK